MSLAKTLIAATHAIGAAALLVLVVPDKPTDVLINEVRAEMKALSTPYSVSIT